MLPLAGVTVTAQSDADAQFSMPHTAWGHPDLQGTWTMETFTPLQRPEHLGDKAFYSEEELEELRELLTAEGVDPLAGNVLAIEDEQEREERLFQTNRDDTYVHYDNELWLRGNTPKGLSSNRTSLIVDPPNGRLPARTEEAAMGVATRREARTGREYDFAPTNRVWFLLMEVHTFLRRLNSFPVTHAAGGKATRLLWRRPILPIRHAFRVWRHRRCMLRSALRVMVMARFAMSLP